MLRGRLQRACGGLIRDHEHYSSAHAMCFVSAHVATDTSMMENEHGIESNKKCRPQGIAEGGMPRACGPQ